MIYKDKDEFLQEINGAILSIQDQINESNTYFAFWDIQRSGREFIAKISKTELNIHPTLKALLLKLPIANFFEIISEYETGSGQLDFLISGILKNNERVSACVEFKYEHNNRLNEGLKNQLPEYMKNKGHRFRSLCYPLV